MAMVHKVRAFFALVATCLMLIGISNAAAEDYPSLDGVKSVQAVFDMRAGLPMSADKMLKVVYESIKAEEVAARSKRSDFAVVFSGPATRLISKYRDMFPPDENEYLNSIADTIEAMAKDGIRLEYCLIAAMASGVDPATIMEEVKQVPNGWVSLMGYQAKGYSLIPVF